MPAEAAPEATPAPKKGSPVKLIVVVGVVLAIEAVVIIGVMKFVGGAAPVHATVVEPLADHADEKIEEIHVFEGKLFNNKSGVTYLYNTEIYVQVRQKNADRVNEELERYSNEIRADMAAIWRTSEPHQFQEPKLENLNRKVTALLNERFGPPKEGEEPVVIKSVIVMSTGFRVDS